VTLADSHVRGQILLQRFQSPQALVKEGNNLYSGLIAAGPLGGATPIPAAPGAANGLGTIQAGALELSNIDLANEFANLITTQRSFQASAKIITTSDEMLQDTINLKR
jgi:flagellar hook protein FlgE